MENWKNYVWSQRYKKEKVNLRYNMFNNTYNKPTDFIAVLELREDRKMISVLFKGITSDNHLMKKIFELKKNFDFRIILTRPVLIFDMQKPEGEIKRNTESG